jgi:hypothetical protein
VVTSSYDTVGGDLPLLLGGGEQRASGVTNPEFDVFVHGLSFNLHINPNSPYRRETAEWRKQQVDQAPEAGEQSLSSWWLRSQMSFHGGSGVKYLDTTADAQTQNRIRFDTCRGVDVWTPGEIKRLPDTELLHGLSSKTFVFGAQVGSESYLVYGSGTTIKADRKVAADTITYTVTGMAGSILSMVIDGSHYYAATTDGKVFKGPIDNSSAGAAIWNTGSSSDVTLGWVKSRLMVGIGPSVYELAGTGPALPAALYTHPSAKWVWTAWSDSPDAVLAAGASGLSSGIYGFTLTESGGGAPVLSPGVPVGELPVGERIESLYLYVGTKLAIGTNLGLRVGEFNPAYGSFSYGPLSVETDGPVTSICGRGPYLYLGAEVEGEASLLRADLGLAVDDGPIYATAPDLRVPTAGTSGGVTALTVDADGRLVFAVQGYGIVREADTYTGRDAWLRTARIRFTTVEPKQFKYGRVRTEGAGQATVQAHTSLFPDDREVFSTPTDVESERFALIGGGAEWIQLTFHLEGSGKINSYQVLALPAQPRQRLFGIPVQIFDSEKNRHGRMVGYPGRAKTLIDELEAIESSGDEVTVQCPVLGIDAVRCTVERIEFNQVSPPVAGKSYGLGGYANLVFRTST